MRVLRARGDIAPAIPDSAVREIVAERGRIVVGGAQVAEEELGKLRLRLSALERLAISVALNPRSDSATAA